MQGDAPSALVNAWSVSVRESPHVVYAQDCENVVKTYAHLHVRGLFHRTAQCVDREAVDVETLFGIVFVRQRAIKTLLEVVMVEKLHTRM